MSNTLHESFDNVKGELGGNGPATVDLETTLFPQPLTPWVDSASIDPPPPDTRTLVV